MACIYYIRLSKKTYMLFIGLRKLTFSDTCFRHLIFKAENLKGPFFPNNDQIWGVNYVKNPTFENH